MSSGSPDQTPAEVKRIIDEPITPLGYEQVTGLAAAKGLTVPPYARFAMITAETQNIRWRDDGTDPTAAVGMPLIAGDIFWYTGDLSTFKAIEQVASAKINVSYYGY